MSCYTGKKSFPDFFKYLSEIGFTFNIVTEKEIEELTKIVFPEKLPSSYVEFMRYTGNGKDFWQGSDYHFSDIDKLKTYAKELLNENSFPLKLKPDDFVFWMHQGYKFCFFNLADGDNPPIYYYNEAVNTEEFIKCSDNFIDFIIQPFIDGKPNFLLCE
jgi:hypothetical protein